MTGRRGGSSGAAVLAVLVLALSGGDRAAAQPDAAASKTPSDAPAKAAAAAPKAGAVELRPEDELLLEARTDKWILTDAFPGYATSRGDYVPLGELSKLLDLAITVDGDAGKAEGWFLDPERTLRLDLNAGFIETAKNGRKPLGAGDAVPLNGDIYVRADLLGQWLPLKVDIVLAKQQLQLELAETFPFEAKIARNQAREGLGFRKTEKIKYPRLDSAFELLTAPAIDVNVRALTGSGATTAQYDIRSSGDLAFMSSDLFFGGDSTHQLTSARLTMRRRDPDREMLGPLRLSLIEFGDTATISQPIGMRSRTGRGLIVGNAPLDRESVFDRIDLRGELPIGYEVELYRNDLLIGSVSKPIDGRYEFLQVPLEFGLNVLRLVFYGPRGERREEVRRINAGEGRLGTGELQFSFGAVQQDQLLIPIRPPSDGALTSTDDEKGAIRFGGVAEYGLSPNITLIGSGASFLSDGRRNNQALLGVRTGVAGAALQLDGAYQGRGRWALQLGLGGRLLGASYILQHADFSKSFIDEVRGGGQSGLKRITQLRLDRGIDLGSVLLASNLVLERTQRLDGAAETTAALRTSTNLWQWMFSNSLAYRLGSGNDTLDGGFEANGRLRGWSLRAGLGYEIRPFSAFREINVTVDRTLWTDLSFRAGFSKQLSRGDALRAALSLSKRLAFMDVAADTQYDTGSKALQIGARISFSVGRQRGRWGFSPPGLAGGGSVLAMAFQDSDGDGLRGAGEKLLSGIKFRGGGGEAVTDSSGRALLTRLGDGRPTEVMFQPDSLPDPYLLPVNNGVEIIPRPGRTQEALFPVVSVSEVEGRAFFNRNGTSRAVASVELELVNKAGEVVETAKTEYDGFFLMEKVRPGTYTIRVNPEQGAKLKVALTETVQVTTEPDGGLVDGVFVHLVSTTPPAAVATETETSARETTSPAASELDGEKPASPADTKEKSEAPNS